MQTSHRRLLSLSLVRWFAVALLGTSWWSGSSAAFAQAEPVLVVSEDAVPEELAEAISDALSEVGSVMSPSSYNAKLRGKAPESESALTTVAPQTGAALIVVLRHARNKVKVELRSGRDGAVVGRSTVPARGKRPKLAKPARKRLIAAAKRARKKIGPLPSKRASSEDDFVDEPAPEATAPSRQPVRPVEPSYEAEGDDEEEEPEQPFDLAAADDEPAPRAHSESNSSDDGMLFRLRAGFGFGTRSIVVPTQPNFVGGGNRIDTSYVPALELGATLDLGLGPKWRLRFVADYRTLFGLQASTTTPMGMMGSSSLSSHSLVAGASLGHLSDGRDSFGIHVFLGWAYRGLSASEPGLPGASLSGLVLRPEVEIPIADRKLKLRLAPEFILNVVPQATLPGNDPALAKAVGTAFGIEASLDLHLSQLIAVSAQFRESRGSTPSGWGSNASENERYITLRLLLQF